VWLALLNIVVHGTHTCSLGRVDGDAWCHHDSACAGGETGCHEPRDHASSNIERDSFCGPSREDEECLACHFLTACKAFSLAPVALVFTETPVAKVSTADHGLACSAPRHSPSAPRAPPSA